MIRHEPPHLDRHQGVLSEGVILSDIVDIIGSDERDVELTGPSNELSINGVLLRKVLVFLKFEIKIGTKMVFVFLDKLESGFGFFFEDKTILERSETARENDQIIGIGSEKGFEVDPRAIREAFEIGNGDHLQDAAITSIIFSQNGQVELVATGAELFVGARVFGHVKLAADDGFDSALGFGGSIIKMKIAIHIAVIGDGDGGLTESFDLRDELLNGGEAVEERKLSVGVKVNEIGRIILMDHRKVDAKVGHELGSSGAREI